jgi:hypothetical protein
VLSRIIGDEVAGVAYAFVAADERIRPLAATAGYRLGFSPSPSGPTLPRMRRGVGLLPSEPFDVKRRGVRPGYGRARFRILLSAGDAALATFRKARILLKERVSN